MMQYFYVTVKEKEITYATHRCKNYIIKKKIMSQIESGFAIQSLMLILVPYLLPTNLLASRKHHNEWWPHVNTDIVVICGNINLVSWKDKPEKGMEIVAPNYSSQMQIVFSFYYYSSEGGFDSNEINLGSLKRSKN